MALATRLAKVEEQTTWVKEVTAQERAEVEAVLSNHLKQERDTALVKICEFTEYALEVLDCFSDDFEVFRCQAI